MKVSYLVASILANNLTLETARITLSALKFSRREKLNFIVLRMIKENFLNKIVHCKIN